ncbi:hypothetical protein R5R35_014281 [Gryllus longicercus]|uniref:Dihydrolipoyllysine-residue succinyltransferase component of 2-oxoglutarate dehydrogenase complex, mitochondrial n=1 Tax=Gryllus longicercus TaxID=2509291 RepID=A0AAN9ZG81_9ORTH
MAGMLQFSSRSLPRNVIRLTSRIWKTENCHVTVKARLYQGLAGRSWVCRIENNATRKRLKVQQNVHHLRTQQFQSTAGLYEEIQTVSAPHFAESVSEGDVKFQKEVGDAVAVDDVVLEIETDKTSVPVPAPASGIIVERLVPDGSPVKAGQALFKLKVTGVAPPKAAAKPVAAGKAAPPKPAAAPAPPTPAKPSAPGKPATAKPAAPAKAIIGTRSETRVKMNRMRQRIAQRLKEAQNTNAMLTTFNEVDMSHIIQFRKQHLEAFQKKYNQKFGFMSPFVKASAFALQDQPVVNAVISGSDIVYRDYIDISIAVATPKGLVVPVLRNVESMNFADIELEISALGNKARKGTLAVEEMDGGTFSISNGGVFGSLMGTPIINPPQSAILGMHGVFDRPIAVKGQVVIRPMMYVALTYDHRLIDGRDAVYFLRKIKDAVEDPRIMFLGL